MLAFARVGHLRGDPGDAVGQILVGGLLVAGLLAWGAVSSAKQARRAKQGLPKQSGWERKGLFGAKRRRRRR